MKPRGSAFVAWFLVVSAAINAQSIVQLPAPESKRAETRPLRIDVSIGGDLRFGLDIAHSFMRLRSECDEHWIVGRSGNREASFEIEPSDIDMARYIRADLVLLFSDGARVAIEAPSPITWPLLWAVTPPLHGMRCIADIVRNYGISSRPAIISLCGEYSYDVTQITTQDRRLMIGVGNEPATLLISDPGSNREAIVKSLVVDSTVHESEYRAPARLSFLIDSRWLGNPDVDLVIESDLPPLHGRRIAFDNERGRYWSTISRSAAAGWGSIPVRPNLPYTIIAIAAGRVVGRCDLPSAAADSQQTISLKELVRWGVMHGRVETAIGWASDTRPEIDLRFPTGVESVGCDTMGRFSVMLLDGVAYEISAKLSGHLAQNRSLSLTTDVTRRSVQLRLPKSVDVTSHWTLIDGRSGRRLKHDGTSKAEMYCAAPHKTSVCSVVIDGDRLHWTDEILGCTEYWLLLDDAWQRATVDESARRIEVHADRALPIVVRWRNTYPFKRVILARIEACETRPEEEQVSEVDPGATSEFRFAPRSIGSRFSLDIESIISAPYNATDVATALSMQKIAVVDAVSDRMIVNIPRLGK